MAIPSYTTDLTTIATGDLNVDAGTWDESSNSGWDTGGAMVDDQNLYYNNTECVSAQMTKDSNGSGTTGPATIMYVHTSSITVPTDGAALIHHLWAAPPALNTLANAGIIVLIGTDLGNFYGWNASGSDFAPAPRGGWANYAINPGIGSPDHTVGTITTYDMVGMAVAATAQARGNPNACNAVRYGRCESRFTGGEAANYATFTGYGAVDDASTAKWNLIEPVEGGFKFQGLMSLGLTGTAVDFREANITINIRDTINVTSAFNAIEVHNASSNVEWTAVSITALGTVSIGTFEAIDNATIAKDACTFTDMGTFIYQSNSTIENSTFRRCALVTQDGATFTGCIFDDATGTAAMIATGLDIITECTFNSDGTGYAIELTSIGDGSMTWTNNLTGYASTDGSTGNEAIFVNVGSGTLAISVGEGATTPTIRTAGATVTVNSDKTITFTGMKDDTEVRVYNHSTGAEVAGIEDVVDGTVDDRSFAWSAPAALVVDYVLHNYDNNGPDYETIRVNSYTVPAANTSIGIQQRLDRNSF